MVKEEEELSGIKFNVIRVKDIGEPKEGSYRILLKEKVVHIKYCKLKYLRQLNYKAIILL